MKIKTFIILLISFCVLAGVAYFNFSHTAGKARRQQMGQTLFDSLPVEKISNIVIESAKGAVNLARKQSLWTVENKYDYLADFSLITDLVSDIKTAKIGRSFQATPDSLSRLGLHQPDSQTVDPDQKGVRVILKDDKDAVLADVIMGKTREMTAGAGGHYILPVREQNIYLVDKKFDDIGKTDKDWIEKNVVDINEKDIESVVCRLLDNKKAVYSLKRAEKGKEAILPDMPDAPLDPSRIDDVLTALSPLTIDDVAGYIREAENSDIDFAFVFEYRLFDRTAYTVIPGQSKDKEKPKYYVKIHGDFTDEGIQPSQKTSPENREGVQGTKKTPTRSGLIQNWLYEIPEWKFKRFIHSTDGLFQKK